MSNVNSLRRIFKITDKDIIYLGTPLTFDPFVIELFLALTTGACLLIVPDHVKLSNKLLLQTILPENKQLHSGVTFIQMPPSVFLCFSEEDIVNMLCKVSSLRILALGGEKFPEQLCKYKRCKQLQLFNLYGITEVSCWASVEEVTAVPVSLGETLDDTMFEIRTTDGNVIQNGEGELFIGGRNRVCVINDECNYEYDSVIYRETGDIVRKDPMSTKIYYIGRTNSIIKRFGQRVCLSEIEQQVFDTTDLHAICVWDEHEMKLFLFIILKSYDAIVKNKIVDRLRIKLLHSLPAAANPDVIEILPSIPLTSNGKVDKQCLLNVIYVNKETNIEISPVNVFENVWSKYFGMSQCEIELRKECSFSEMGGNSILAIQLITDFDSCVSNSFSTDLMALFFDRNKCYKDYCSLIERNYKINSTASTKRSKHVDTVLSKSMKVSDKCNIPTVLLNIVWKYELGACVDATPVYIKHQRFGDLIAIGCHAHVFVILNAISGAVVSKTTLSSAVEGSACSAGCNERIIVGCYDGYVYCLNISDATVVWKYKTASSIKCTPILSSNNENIIFGSYDKALYCLKIKDGSLVWKLIIDESIKSNPILHDQKCYIATIQGTCLSVCENTGKCLWKSKTNTAIFGSPRVLNHENIILWPDVKGHIQCHSCINGEKLWTYQSAGFIYSSLCSVGNRVIFGCFDHHIYILECHVDGCKLIFKLNVGGQISGKPCVFSSADDKEYLIGVSNAGKLHMFSLDTALLLQTIDLPAEVFSSPVIVRNRTAGDGYVTHLQNKSLWNAEVQAIKLDHCRVRGYNNSSAHSEACVNQTLRKYSWISLVCLF
ncbi:Aminoadipate-semialdehyde dehydrogenase [Carabus blaptoides fortunei]